MLSFLSIEKLYKLVVFAGGLYSKSGEPAQVAFIYS